VSAGGTVFEHVGPISSEDQRLAYKALQLAAAIGDTSHNQTLSSLALGSLGRLYERAGQIERASALTDRALFAASRPLLRSSCFVGSGRRRTWHGGKGATRPP